jgi:hypothetical protein
MCGQLTPFPSHSLSDPVAKSGATRAKMHFDVKHILRLKRSHVRFYDSMLDLCKLSRAIKDFRGCEKAATTKHEVEPS